MPAVRGVPPTGPDGGGSRETDGDRPRRPTRGLRSAIRDIWSLAPSYLVPGVASFVAVPALFATLGPAEYGRWALIYAVAAGGFAVTGVKQPDRLTRHRVLEAQHVPAAGR